MFITSHCPFIDILVTLTMSPTWGGQKNKTLSSNIFHLISVDACGGAVDACDGGGDGGGQKNGV